MSGPSFSTRDLPLQQAGFSLVVAQWSESEVTQSCLTLRDPMDCSLPGSSVHGIFQARVLEWGAVAFSVCRLSCAAACRILVPQPGIKPTSPALQGRFSTTGPPGSPCLSLPIISFSLSGWVFSTWSSSQLLRYPHFLVLSPLYNLLHTVPGLGCETESVQRWWYDNSKIRL